MARLSDRKAPAKFTAEAMLHCFLVLVRTTSKRAKIAAHTKPEPIPTTTTVAFHAPVHGTRGRGDYWH